MFKDRTVVTFLSAFVLIALMMMFRANTMFAEGRTTKNVYWTNKAHNSHVYDMVLIGDSRMRNALSPTEMSKTLSEHKIFNYGWTNGGLNSEIYKYTDKKIDKASSKKAIIIGVTPNSLLERNSYNDNFWYEKNKKKEEVYANLYASRLIELTSPIKLSSFRKTFPKNFAFNEYYIDGWKAAWFVEDNPNFLLDIRKGFYQGEQVSEKLTQDLIDQVRKWVKEGVAVYAFLPPTHDVMYNWETPLKKFDEQKIVARFKEAGGIWFDVDRKKYHCFDGSHLSKEGALLLSQDLARLIEINLEKKP